MKKKTVIYESSKIYMYILFVHCKISDIYLEWNENPLPLIKSRRQFS